jgi:hypothetical protein
MRETVHHPVAQAKAQCLFLQKRHMSVLDCWGLSGV